MRNEKREGRERNEEKAYIGDVSDGCLIRLQSTSDLATRIHNSKEKARRRKFDIAPRIINARNFLLCSKSSDSNDDNCVGLNNKSNSNNSNDIIIAKLI